MPGPLHGLRIIEMVGLGPAPLCAMLFADLGAEVIRIDRPRPDEERSSESARFDVPARGRRCITLDLRQPEAAEVALQLAHRADVLIEGFRPGVMERLGLGPDIYLSRQPRLVYARITGWGQTGPLAHTAGHDINFLALSGALHAIGRAGHAPVPPLNLVADYGGGAMLCAVGILAALQERNFSGKGQVVDAAMVDGAAMLCSLFYGLRAAERWSSDRGENLLDSGAHFYETYACADGKYIAVGAIEPQFYALLLERCGLDDPAFEAQMDRHAWPILKNRMADVFRTRTRAQWCSLLEGTDACFAPVLDWEEAPAHPHNRARGTFVTIDGVTQPAPAPRFSRTPADPPRPPGAPGSSDATLLQEWGVDPALIQRVRSQWGP